MTTYYVATLARYVLVDAADENEARAKGRAALHELYADVRERQVPIDIRTVRHATDDEVQLRDWHDAMVAREGQPWSPQRLRPLPSRGCEFCNQSFNQPDGQFTCPYCGKVWKG